MSVNAGDLVALSCDHDEVGNVVFEPVGGEAHNTMIGGFKNETASLANAGQIIKKTRYPWSMEPSVGTGDGILDKLQALADSPAEGQWVATFANGESRTGKGIPVDDIAGDYMEGKIGFKISGSGKFELF
jgi:hypothetical protein